MERLNIRLKMALTLVVFWTLSAVLGCAKRPQVAVQDTDQVVQLAAAPSPTKALRNTMATPPGIDAEVLPLSLSLRPQFGTLPAGKETEINLLVALTGAGRKNSTRPPLDLAVVIDRSGSMSGQKIVSVKSAALTLLKSLTPADQVSLISYADDVRVHTTMTAVDQQGAELLRREILSINASGGTALGPAAFAALSTLVQVRQEGSDRLSHMMLLSDGLANIGESDPVRIGERTAAAFANGVSVSTLGVGLDYNEDLMTHVADQGGGQYHFIKEEAQIASVLNEELGGLMAQVARETVLSIEPADGVGVGTVYGYPMMRDAGRVEVRLGGFRGNQQRDFVVNMGATTPTASKMNIGRFFLQFKDVETQRLRKWQGELVLDVSGDEAAVVTSEVTEVTVRVAELESAKEMTLAAKAVENGDFDAAETVIDRSIQVLEKQASHTQSEVLKTQIKSMRKAKSDLTDAKSSDVARKTYIKEKKSSAYKKSKRSSQSFRRSKSKTKPKSKRRYKKKISSDSKMSFDSKF